MALIACHECNRQISTEAKVCPHCGAATKRKGAGRVIKIIGIVWALLAAPLLTIAPPALVFLAITPGILLFIIGRAME